MARFKKGDYKVTCARTGAIVNASDCVVQWDGLFVLRSVADPQHPLDRASSVRETKRPAHPHPPGEMTFIAATDVTADDL